VTETTPTPAVELKALDHLRDLLERSNGEWAAEQQWRNHADRPQLIEPHAVEPVVGPDGQPLVGGDGKPKMQPVDRRARGFRIEDMLERGLIVKTTAAFHASRNGEVMPAVPLFRPA
jgi:hypothetical protein